MAAKNLVKNALDSCLFCKIIKKDTIPSFELINTDLSYSFLDVNPLSEGHALVIPKYHAQKLHELPDEYLADVMPVAKKIALAQAQIALGPEAKDYQYNLLQNNGDKAHQEVNHVHFHVIPKIPKGPPGDKWDESEGLVVGWPKMFKEMGKGATEEDKLKAKEAKDAALKATFQKMTAQLEQNK
ncbi:HIT-like protein [Mycena polygramma]|nr:HIT-like protein [Mycena polygramma]